MKIQQEQPYKGMQSDQQTADAGRYMASITERAHWPTT